MDEAKIGGSLLSLAGGEMPGRLAAAGFGVIGFAGALGAYSDFQLRATH